MASDSPTDEIEQGSTRRSVLLGLGAGAAGAVLGATGTAGADDGDDNGGSAARARLRVAHAAADVPAVDVDVDGETVFSGAAFGDVTDYATLDSGVHEFEATPTGGADQTVLRVTAAVGPGDFTVVAMGDDGAVVPMLLQDTADLTTVGPDRALLRVVHAIPGPPSVTIATAGGHVLADDVPLISDVGFAEATGYVTVPAGQQTLQVRLADDPARSVAESTIELHAGEGHTAFAMPAFPVKFVVVHDTISV